VATSKSADYKQWDESDYYAMWSRRAGSVINLITFKVTTSSIAAWPQLKELFLRLNAPLWAIATVERLFSTAGLVMSHKRTRLSDRNFENLVFVKANHLCSLQIECSVKNLAALNCFLFTSEVLCHDDVSEWTLIYIRHLYVRELLKLFPRNVEIKF
jgi:hypothetical protein